MSTYLTTYEEYQFQHVLLDNYPELFDTYQFEKIYELATEKGLGQDLIAKIYPLMLDFGVNVLDHIKNVPEHFGYNSDIKKIRFPKNVEKILPYAFMAAELEKITIENPNIKIDDNGFKWCEKIKEVIYSGTCKQFHDNILGAAFTQWTNENLLIRCTDDNIIFNLKGSKR